MDDGRLGAVNRGIRRNRKIIYVTNEIIKNKQKLYESSLVRDHDNMVYKMAASEFKARKAALMNRVLLQCLNVNKKVSKPSNASDLGVYGGRPLDSFSKDIEQWIAWQHPRLRRLRKVDQIKRNCLDQGEILKEEVAKSRMDQFFQQMREDEERKALAKLRLQAMPQRKLRWRGGLPVYDDQEAREGDFPDPYGTAKQSLDVNPLERLAGLIPNQYKADLLKPLWIDTPRVDTGKDMPRGDTGGETSREDTVEDVSSGGAGEETPMVRAHEVTDKLHKGRGNETTSFHEKYDRLPSIDSNNNTQPGSNSFNSRNSVTSDGADLAVHTPNMLYQKLTLVSLADPGYNDTAITDEEAVNSNSGGSQKMTRASALVLPPIKVTKESMK